MATPTATDIAARARKARELEIPVKCGWVFKLRRPSDLKMRDAFASVAARELPSQFQEEQIYAALIGWQGPTVADVDPGAADDQKGLALPFDRELFDALFGDRPELLDEIGAELLKGFVSRLKARTDAEKNLPTSSSSAPS